MNMRTCLIAALTLITALSPLPSSASRILISAEDDALRALDGEWTFLEDRTEGKALEELGPPMASKFSMRTDADSKPPAVILVSGHGSGHKDVRIALDGSVTEVPGERAGSVARYRARWNDGTLTYEVEFVRAPGQAPEGLIRRDFRMTDDGLIVRYNFGAPEDAWWVGLYRHAEDIPLPTPFKATISDLAWLAGDWVGTRGEGNATTIEERWSPPAGGAMLAVARSVRAEKMRTFEFLRIVEIEGTLVYKAQPGGAPPTEFTLTDLTRTEQGATRAVFDNPRHDYPKRIVYELSPDGRLTATTGNMKGGTPRRLEFAPQNR